MPITFPYLWLLLPQHSCDHILQNIRHNFCHSIWKKTTSNLYRTIMFLGCLFWLNSICILSAQAITVYKTTGNFGETKYSQFPPKSDSEVEILELRSNGQQSYTGKYPADTANRPLANIQQQTNHTPQHTQSSQQKYVQKHVTTAHPQLNSHCQTLQTNLANLTATGRVYKLDANGQRIFLNAHEIELQRDNTKKLLAQYCATPTS